MSQHYGAEGTVGEEGIGALPIVPRLGELTDAVVS